jgi:hypothetical protein
VTNSVFVTIGDLICESRDEFHNRVANFYPALLPLILDPELDLPIADRLDTMLSYRRPANIPACISQKVLFGGEAINMHTPPSVLVR